MCGQKGPNEMRYVIFGSGRVGSAMAAYLTSLGEGLRLIPHAQARDEPDQCRAWIDEAEIVAAAIPDDALAAWRRYWAGAIGQKLAIHFSGAAAIENMYAYHPLYSFPKGPVAPEVMAGVPFACPANGPPFKEVFPGAGNPNFELADSDRARYHALAVLSGNLSAFLWNRTAGPFQDLSGLRAQEIMGVYLQSLIDRFLETPEDSLTGPVARRDGETVKANMAALQGEPELTAFYKAFLDAAWPDYPD